MNTKQENRILDPMALWGVEMSKPEMWALIEAAHDLQKALKEMTSMHALMMKKTNHGASFYDAECLHKMNAAPTQAMHAIAKSEGRM